jgi:hypothetical protein
VLLLVVKDLDNRERTCSLTIAKPDRMQTRPRRKPTDLTDGAAPVVEFDHVDRCPRLGGTAHEDDSLVTHRHIFAVGNVGDGTQLARTACATRRTGVLGQHVAALDA